MNIGVYEYTLTDLQQFANNIKDKVIEELGKEELLTEPANAVAGSRVVILNKKNWLGIYFEKLFPTDEGAFRVNIMKMK